MISFYVFLVNQLINLLLARLVVSNHGGFSLTAEAMGMERMQTNPNKMICICILIDIDICFVATVSKLSLYEDRSRDPSHIRESICSPCKYGKNMDSVYVIQYMLIDI